MRSHQVLWTLLPAYTVGMCLGAATVLFTDPCGVILCCLVSRKVMEEMPLTTVIKEQKAHKRYFSGAKTLLEDVRQIIDIMLTFKATF